ncbi:three-helix bundle dimerization domain-containing protein [Cryobacterium sp. TMT3-29-2]|uniref:three-helix bundle dimerization domain-containing protein n=1 Tax=Cryobacterium sp. TMT3-29-2 TaxID=2555867 RepID=UPI00107325CC|nr:hypothetical protein E3O67_16695 [Cryobacterium sp. TMT3-29-2]
MDRLTQRFPAVPRSRVERDVREEHEALSGRPIRDFIPALVEHGVTERMRKQCAPFPCDCARELQWRQMLLTGHPEF